MIITTLSEKTVVDNMMNVQLIQKRVTILEYVRREMEYGPGVTHFGNRCSENDDFIKLAHTFHELIHTRAFDHVHIVILPLNLDRDCEVGLV